MEMTFSKSQSLCIDCGLCCGGLVFEDVELRDAEEALTMESLGLAVEEEEDGFFLVQPCRALNGTQCRVYEHRPECCRRFECLLLKDYQQGTKSKAEALDLIEEVRDKMKSADKEPARRVIRKHFLGWLG